MPSDKPRRAATLQDVADRCGVHKMTVSRALRGLGVVHPDTLQRIQSAARALGYNPAAQESARRLSLRRSGRESASQVFALFFPPYFYRANYFNDMYRGILDALTAERHALLTSYILDPPPADWHLALPPVFARGDVDGVMFLGRPAAYGHLRSAFRQLGSMARKPVVSLIWETPGCHAVLTDDESGAHQAATHLLDLGHRHIAYFALELGEAVQVARLGGIRRALTSRKLAPDKHLHATPLWLGTQSVGHHLDPPNDDTLRAAADFFDQHPQITAVIAPNDANAIRLRSILKALGRRVPEDVSIIGFDDTDAMPGPQGENLLTSVRLPLAEVGAAAAKLMLAHVARGSRARPQRVMLPTTLVVRASTGPCPRR